MERRSLLMRSGVVLISLQARSERFGIRLAAAFGPKGIQELRGLRVALDVEQQLAVFLGGLPARGVMSTRPSPRSFSMKSSLCAA